MGKSLYIAEKPSVAREFAKALKINAKNENGYLESDEAVVTWCVGHLVTMSYPDVYDPQLKKWSLSTIPFIPKEYKYEIIPGVSKQFNIVSGLLNRKDIDTIYVCTDSGREGEYIYRLVEQMSGVRGKARKRVWIDSQTEEEILRGIQTAKDLSAYDNLGNAAYLRAQEDYLMGINFSRVLTLRYGNLVKNYLKADKGVIAVGRVMTCVLGIVVDREREIRDFVKTPFYRVIGSFPLEDNPISGEWKAVEGSKYFESPLLYKENGFSKREDAEKMMEYLLEIEMKATTKDDAECTSSGAILPEEVGNASGDGASMEAALPEQGGALSGASEASSGAGEAASGAAEGTLSKATSGTVVEPVSQKLTPQRMIPAVVEKVEKKTEKKNPPLLYNLAELQNDCSKLFKINPDETLKIAQDLYEKKLTTYPRTDARVLSTAVAKEIHKNIGGLQNYALLKDAAQAVLAGGSHKKIASTKYVNDKQITDHYAIIPTGQGFNALSSLSPTARKVYEIIARRFLAIFMEPAEYQKVGLTIRIKTECFFANFKVLKKEGYLSVMKYSFAKPKTESASSAKDIGGAVTAQNGGEMNLEPKMADGEKEDGRESEQQEMKCTPEFLEKLSKLRKGTPIPCSGFEIKEGETKPPKRYNSGSIILAMENAGQFIEDEDMRAMIKGSGIGTSATRAGILTKLFDNKYLALNKKTQIITPTLLGEMIYDVVLYSIKSLLNPKLTASWELGLTRVADGTVTKEEYVEKLNSFVTKHTEYVKATNYQSALYQRFNHAAQFYKKAK